MRRDLATSILVTTLRYWWQIYRKKSHQHDVITKTTVATCCRFGMGKFGQIRQGLFWFFEKKYLESLFIRLSKTIFFAWFFEFFAIHSCSLKIFSFTNRSFSCKYHRKLLHPTYNFWNKVTYRTSHLPPETISTEATFRNSFSNWKNKIISVSLYFLYLQTDLFLNETKMESP